jgi:hypothetical protein
MIESLHMSPFFIADVNDFGKLKYRGVSMITYIYWYRGTNTKK